MEHNLNKAKNKLFAKAFDAATMGGNMMAGDDSEMNMMMPPNQPPLNINLDIDPRTDRKVVGVDYVKQLGDNKSFNIGGQYQPEYETEQPGFFPGQTIEFQNPSNYNVRAGYKGKNFGFNVNVGTGGGNMNFNRQF
jgi:hypothetical protein|tara:strand:+ start:432 stop:839 length:408 start_codon:yes stop_codon:yes gene_type:complete